MRIAVTGASGFVGGALCRFLTAQNIDVLAFGRRAHVPSTHTGNAPYQAWDITSGPLPNAPSVDVVVHCAGTVTDWGPSRDFFITNQGGTKNALTTFPTARFIHISTASVYDPYRPTIMATEAEAPVRRYMNAYGASKAAAERTVIATMPHREAIILRPHAIYGPGDTTLLPRVLSAVRGPLLPAVGTGGQSVSLTSIHNLTQACLLAAQAPTATGIFNITDAEPILLDDAFRSILTERNIAARPIYLPLRALRPAAAIIEGAFLLARRPNPPRLTPYAVSHLAVDRTLDITAARKQLGYAPAPTSFTGAASW